MFQKVAFWGGRVFKVPFEVCVIYNYVQFSLSLKSLLEISDNLSCGKQIYPGLNAAVQERKEIDPWKQSPGWRSFLVVI